MYIQCQGVLWGLHCVPFVSLWGALGSLWDALGRHWDALGHTLGHLGLHWRVLGMPWDRFGTPWARCWHVWGSFWDIFELRCAEPPSRADGSHVPRLRTKTSLLELARRFRGNGLRTTVQAPRSTRAGDQDDVSFTNSLKLYLLPPWKY